MLCVYRFVKVCSLSFLRQTSLCGLGILKPCLNNGHWISRSPSNYCFNALHCLSLLIWGTHHFTPCHASGCLRLTLSLMCVCRYDEMGVLFTVIISANTLENGLLLVRNRDTTIRETMHISEVKKYLQKYINAADNI